MKRKVGVILVVMLLTVTVSPIAFGMQNITDLSNQKEMNSKKIVSNEERTINITVYRIDDNNEKIPVKMASVYIYQYPIKVPAFFDFTNDFGNLYFDPWFYIGDDIKINAYHKWYGGCTIIYSITTDDPDIIYFELVLDSTKSLIKQRNPLTYDVFRFLKNIQEILGLSKL